MHKLALALAITCALSVVFALVGYELIGKDFATAFGLIPLFAFNTIIEQIEKQQRGEIINWTPPAIIRQKGFAVGWKPLFFLGILITALAPQAGAGIGLVVFNGILGPAAAAVSQIVKTDASAVGTLTVGITAAFTYGRWVGRRCFKYAFVVALLAPIAGAAVGHGIDYLMSAEKFQRILGLSRSFTTFSRQVLYATAFFVPPSLLGCWFGRRGQVGEYMRYLARTLSPDRQQALVSLIRKG